MVPQTEAEARPTQISCRHHWVIESPHGATSQGICKNCSAVREFRNSLEEPFWEREAALLPRVGRGGSRVSTDIYPGTAPSDLWDGAL